MNRLFPGVKLILRLLFSALRREIAAQSIPQHSCFSQTLSLLPFGLENHVLHIGQSLVI